MKILMSLIYFSAFILIGCDNYFITDNDQDKEKKPIEKAWDLYKIKNYASSHRAFSELKESNKTGAFTGLGWICLRMDSISEAGAYFQEISNDTVIDAFAGWSVILWLQKDFISCIEKGNVVLNKKPNYKFIFDKTVTFHDVIIHMGFSYYRLRNFDQCIQMIQMLDTTFTAPTLNDPNLDEILILKLEQLAETYR